MEDNRGEKKESDKKGLTPIRYLIGKNEWITNYN